MKTANDGAGRILVIVPAYNEEGALAGSVASLLEYAPPADVLVVNDGSSDGTGRVARQLAVEHGRVRVVTLPVNSGIGAAVQTGLMYAGRHGYDLAVQFDADGQHDADYLAALCKPVEAGEVDLCIGSRFLDLSRAEFRSTPLRRLGIRFFSLLITLLCGVRVTDPTSGFRAYGRKAIELFSRTYPDDYPEPESVFWSARNGLRVAEVPVRMFERAGGVSSIRYLNTAYYMIKVTVAIVVDRLRSKEGLGE